MQACILKPIKLNEVYAALDTYLTDTPNDRQ